MDNWKGTKGEWFAHVVSTFTIGVNAEIYKNKRAQYSKKVCEFILPETDEEYEQEREEREANARLIAASPDLLEALQESLFLLNQMKNKRAHGLEGVFITSAIEKSQNAISKALGE